MRRCICSYAMFQRTTPNVVLRDSHELKDTISAHIKVTDENDLWIGDFWVDFEHRPSPECEDRYVADWSTIKSGGNGKYTDDDPCFWMVEEIVGELEARYTPATLETVDSGPKDK